MNLSLVKLYSALTETQFSDGDLMLIFIHEVVCVLLSYRTGGGRSSVRCESSAVGHSGSAASEIHRQGGDGPRAALVHREGPAAFLILDSRASDLFLSSIFVFIIK